MDKRYSLDTPFVRVCKQCRGKSVSLGYNDNDILYECEDCNHAETITFLGAVIDMDKSNTWDSFFAGR